MICMGKKNIFIYVLVFVFLVSITLVGYYFYTTYLSNKTSTENQDLVSNSAEINATISGLKNGGNKDFPQLTGGIDDYNNGGTTPSDTYNKVWVLCTSNNNFCGTKDVNAEKKDPGTGIIWSKTINLNGDWFVANNCKYPNNLADSDGVCDTNGEVACLCVKHETNKSDAKTGCEALGDGDWRLPYQKELMQAYIDGAYSNLSDPNNGYWASTTRSEDTQTAWVVYLNSGNTGRNDKTVTDYAMRCVR